VRYNRREKTGGQQSQVSLSAPKAADAPAALMWIDRALADDKGVSRHDEFGELRYEIRRALGEAEALDDLKAAVGLAAEGRRRTRLQVLLAAATA
jgi:hypothetical protein